MRMFLRETINLQLTWPHNSLAIKIPLQYMFFLLLNYFELKESAALKESVIASGNSTFQQNLDLETVKKHENHLFDLWFTRKTKNTMPFLSISLVFIKSKISANFFQIGWGIFRISLRYCLQCKSIFSCYHFYFTYREKVKTRNLSSFFSFSPFTVNQKEGQCRFEFLEHGAVVLGTVRLIYTAKYVRVFSMFFFSGTAPLKQERHS